MFSTRERCFLTNWPTACFSDKYCVLCTLHVKLLAFLLKVKRGNTGEQLQTQDIKGIVQSSVLTVFTEMSVCEIWIAL